MSARRALLLTLGGLLLLQLLTSFVTLGVLGRMTPAIEQIRGDNLLSVEAAGEMLALLGTSATADAAAVARFEAALGRAEANVTEDGERAALAALHEHGPAAIAGPGPAREAAIAALQDLVHVNLEVTERVDLEAQRLGLAGGWAVAVFGLLALALSVLVLRRLGAGFLDPLAHLQAVAAAHRGGDQHRRVGLVGGAPEFQDIGRLVDGLLDERLGWASLAFDPTEEPDVVRRALLHQLDLDPLPRFVLDDAGRPVACSRAGLTALGEDVDGALKSDLLAMVRGVEVRHPGLRGERIAEGTWLATLGAAAPPG